MDTPSAIVDPAIRSFVPVADDSHFPIQNLPYGAFRPRAGGPPRIAVAIGQQVLDLAMLERRGLLDAALTADGSISTKSAGGEPLFARPTLNAFMARGQGTWRAVRRRLVELLREAHAAGTTILGIFHDLDVLRQLADSYILMRDGRIAGQGAGADIPAHALLAAAR